MNGALSFTQHSHHQSIIENVIGDELLLSVMKGRYKVLFIIMPGEPT